VESELRQRLQTLTPAQLELLALGSGKTHKAYGLAAFSESGFSWLYGRGAGGAAEKLAGMDPVLRRSTWWRSMSCKNSSNPGMARWPRSSRQKIRSTLLHMFPRSRLWC